MSDRRLSLVSDPGTTSGTPHAIFPAIIAALTLYGLVADPETVAAQVRALAAVLPQQAQQIVADQLQSVSSTSPGALGFGLVVSLLAALWSASTACGVPEVGLSS